MDKKSVDKTQEEIIEEMAKALGHTGLVLEKVLTELIKIESELDDIQDKDEYNRMIDKYNMLRKQALTRRQMLIIHREALGFRKHAYLDQCYPIPGRKNKK